MSLDKLREIAADFRALGWAQGAVELPLQCALAWDAENLAAEWGPPGPASADIPASSLVLHHTAGGRDQGTQLRGVWERRMQCYDLVLESLQAFDALVQSATAENEVRERVARRDEAYGIALSSADRMWHSRLYDWMIEKGLTDALLQVCVWCWIA
jgi:nuclear pore complex protein Nup155